MRGAYFRWVLPARAHTQIDIMDGMLRNSLSALLLVVAVSGCGRDSATSYRIPKEKEEPMGMQAMSAAPSPAPSGRPLPGGEEMAGSHGEAGALRWKAPAGWKELPASGMRLASFTVPGAAGAPPADLSVVSLSGEAGGELANVNRWRGQLGLDPLNEKELEAQSKRIKSSAGTLLVVECAGPKGRIHAAILNVNGNTWFFKLTGEEATVSAARERFLEFLKSLRFN